MCSNCAGDYENPELTAEDLEFSDYGRETSRGRLIAVWAGIVAFCLGAWASLLAVIPGAWQVIARLF